MENNFFKIENTLDYIAGNISNRYFVNEKLIELRKQAEILKSHVIFDEFIESIDCLESFLNSNENNSKLFYEYFYKSKEIVHKVSVKRIEFLQKELEQTNIEDFMVESLDCNKLVLVGSFDFGYYHEIEIIFSYIDLLYLKGTNFHVNKIRLATHEELTEIHMKDYKDGFVICLEHDWYEEKNYIATHYFNYNWGIVYYYMRENLKPGERIADGVLIKNMASDKM